MPFSVVFCAKEEDELEKDIPNDLSTMDLQTRLSIVFVYFRILKKFQ